MKTTSRIGFRTRRITFYTPEMVVKLEFTGWAAPELEIGCTIKGVARLKPCHYEVVRDFLKGNRRRVEKFLLQPCGDMDCDLALLQLNKYIG